MSMITEKFGERIRQIRNLRGISQEQLALKAQVNVSFLGQIERGNKKPTIDTIDKLLNALDISFKDFFDFEGLTIQSVDFSVINKIIYELKTRSTEEQQLIYDIMRRILVYNDYTSI